MRSRQWRSRLLRASFQKDEEEDQVRSEDYLQVFCAREFYNTLQSSHYVKEMHELVAVHLEFSELGMVKIEFDHPILGIDTFIARLNELRRATGPFPPSPKQHIEEIEAIDFVKIISMYPATTAGAVPASNVTKPSIMELVEPVVEATPIFQ